MPPFASDDHHLSDIMNHLPDHHPLNILAHGPPDSATLQLASTPVHEKYQTNNNIGSPHTDAKKGRVVSLWAFALITIAVIVFFALCSLWCRRKYKKHLLEQKLKEDKDEENKGKNGMAETGGDPDKQEGLNMEK